ncbi:MAG: hypothetical protein PUD73_10230 [bacterium]|nr:hypothetical protein [bacterium]
MRSSLYAFLGWCAEVIFATARKGVFVNRHGAIALRKKNEALRKVLRERQEKENFVERRLVHAFPGMRSLKNREALEAFKEHVRERREQRKKDREAARNRNRE